MTAHCPSCAPLAADVARLRNEYKVLTQMLDAFLKRSGFPLVPREEARAILSPAEPLAPVVALADRRAL
jgi:hypothetical protein